MTADVYGCQNVYSLRKMKRMKQKYMLVRKMNYLYL